MGTTWAWSLQVVARPFATLDGDLDPTAGGVAWWVGHPVGDRRRILIADHLLQCARSIEKNLVDARLHQLALQHCEQLEERLLRHMVTTRRTRDGIGFSMEFPRAQSARDDLPRTLGDLHRVGFFQAIGSALDCLGGAIIGVLGIPIDLLRSDLGNARRWLTRQVQGATTTFEATFFRAFGVVLERSITSAGPLEWLDWTLDMRNMLMHRARRLQLSTLNPRNSGVIDANENPLTLTDSAMHLPRSPSHSDIEVMVATTFEPLLHEDSMTTIAGVLESTKTLTREACDALRRAWLLRRSQPDAIVQPRQQWGNTPRPGSRFPGYAPGSRPFQMNALLGHNSVVRRMQVGLLMDDQRQRWVTFT